MIFCAAFNELAAPEVSYVLAFSPHPLKHDGAFHNLKVKLKTSRPLHRLRPQGLFCAPRWRTDVASATCGSHRAPVTGPGARKPLRSGNEALPHCRRSMRKLWRQPTRSPDEILRSRQERSAGAYGQGRGSHWVVAQRCSTFNFNCGAAHIPRCCPRSAPSGRFCNRAVREVEHYTEAFADLTADETRVMQSFDEHGFAARSVPSNPHS